jgi:UDP-glucose 4-epimerase
VDSLIPEYGGREDNVSDIRDRVRINISDVRDRHSVESLVRGQHVIFNLAGQTSHLDSMTDPETDLEINCRSQLSLLEACRRNNPEARVVFASTRQLYGRPRYLPVDEEHPLAPVDVNGINKLAGEWYHLVYEDVYGIPVSVLRLTNTYGPRMRVKDARQTFLGWWLRQLLTGQELTIYGDGKQRRDFSYVDDAVDAFLLAGSRDEAIGEVFNLASPEVISLTELAELLIHVNGAGAYRLVPFPEDRKRIDIGDYFGDSSKIAKTLGWTPTVSLEQGLERTVAFYREHGDAFWDS